MIQPIRIIDYDNVLIQIDRFIFGTDPTRALFTIANPVLTELLQIVYGTFFFLPVILAIDLMLNDRYEDVKFATFTVVWGFVLSYIGYFLVPAIGPRFTLHDFAATNTELPGLFLTNYLREIVNAGESIAKGIPNPAEVVQRDVFPSGHTQMTLIVMYLSIKMKTKSRYFFAVNGTLLIFSTVYLRYHYAVDVLGGVLFMIITIWSGKYLYNWWIKKSGGILYDNS
jgi:membrane-associated phospholipid phosphatase